MSLVEQTIIKMADKMAAAYQFASVHCCGHSNFLIFLPISSNFHIWIASITLWLKFEYEFCPTNDSQNGPQMVAAYQCALMETLPYPIASKLHIWITFIKLSPKFEYGLCQLTRWPQKWPQPISLHLWTLINLVIYHPISQVPNFITY